MLSASGLLTNQALIISALVEGVRKIAGAGDFMPSSPFTIKAQAATSGSLWLWQ